MLPSPEDLADLVVPAVAGREVVGAEVDEVERGVTDVGKTSNP